MTNPSSTDPWGQPVNPTGATPTNDPYATPAPGIDPMPGGGFAGGAGAPPSYPSTGIGAAGVADEPTLSSSSTGGDASTKDVAKDQAGEVKDTAVGAAQSVAQTAKEQASNVVAEAKTQTKDLASQLRGEIGGQASTQLSRVAGAVHSLSHELGTMASKAEEQGPVTDLVHEASRRTGEVAHWLENREPVDLLDDVRNFARRRPGTFLAICFGAGLLAGRVTRGAVAANTKLDSPSGTQSTGAPRRAADLTPTGPAFVAPAEPVGLGTTGYQSTGYESTGYQSTGYGTTGAYGTAPASTVGPDADLGSESALYPGDAPGQVGR